MHSAYEVCEHTKSQSFELAATFDEELSRSTTRHSKSLAAEAIKGIQYLDIAPPHFCKATMISHGVGPTFSHGCREGHPNKTLPKSRKWSAL